MLEWKIQTNFKGVKTIQSNIFEVIGLPQQAKFYHQKLDFNMTLEIVWSHYDPSRIQLYPPKSRSSGSFDNGLFFQRPLVRNCAWYYGGIHPMQLSGQRYVTKNGKHIAQYQKYTKMLHFRSFSEVFIHRTNIHITSQFP